MATNLLGKNEGCRCHGFSLYPLYRSLSKICSYQVLPVQHFIPSSIQVTMPKLLLNSLSTCWLVFRAGRDKLLSAHKSLAGASLGKSATWGSLKVPNGNDTLALAQRLLSTTDIAVQKKANLHMDPLVMMVEVCLECCSQIFGSLKPPLPVSVDLHWICWPEKELPGLSRRNPTTRWCQNYLSAKQQ